MPGCSKVVLNVGRHLTEGKCHGLKKGSVEYKIMMKSAKPYTGFGEIQCHLSKPDPKRTSDTESEVDDEPIRVSKRKKRKLELCSEEDEDQVEHEAEEVMEEVVPAEEDDEEEEEETSGEESEKDDEEDSNDSDSDSVPQKTKNEDYFTNHSTTNHRQRWLVGFYDYLSRPSAGNKKDSIRLQHATQVRALLEHIEPGGDDITCLAEHQGDAVWKLWVRPMLDGKHKKPGTIISYLTSFEKFLFYITNTRYNRFDPPMHPSYQEIFSTVLPEIKGWRSTVDAQTQHVQNQCYLDETEGLLSLQELMQLRSSKPYVEAQKILKQAGEGKILSQQKS